MLQALVGVAQTVERQVDWYLMKYLEHNDVDSAP